MKFPGRNVAEVIAVDAILLTDTDKMRPRRAICSDHDGILALLREVDWHARVTEHSRFALMMQSSELTAVAEDHGKVIGFGYALSDRVANGFITILAVHPKWRKQGLGKALAQYLMTGDAHVTWLLRTGEELRPFWGKLGFQGSEYALERERAVD